ncbi:caspase family protein [Streptomyces odontomachi]|uniref:caspase family protein n=1 Tax=Streptomyces odontomachi TaxID=2944940 RepID=UPI00210BFEB4|nr:caspase family protein [Streptomyces sp. ODS25]
MVLRAVIAGVDRYQDTDIKNLSYATADALAVADLLGRLHPSEVDAEVLVDEDATRRNLMVAIGERLPRVTSEGDVVLLYFAGHGSPETTATIDDAARYLVVHDTEYDSVFATGLDMERELPRLFERIRRPRLVLMLIDACFSGRAGGRTFEGPRLRAERSHVRGEHRVSLKGLDLGEGRLMIAACDDHQVAREEAAIGHGVFTNYLLKGPSAAGDSETVGILHLYEDIAASVRGHTGGLQTPVLNGRSALARFPRVW